MNLDKKGQLRKVLNQMAIKEVSSWVRMTKNEPYVKFVNEKVRTKNFAAPTTNRFDVMLHVQNY